MTTEERIFQKLEAIEKAVADIKTDVKLINVRMNNHDDRIVSLEQQSVVTLKNCAENIPKVKNACKKADLTSDDLKKLRTQALFALLTIILALILTPFLK